MRKSICQSCRQNLRLRLDQRLSAFQHAQRNKSTASSIAPLQSWYGDTSPPTPRQLASAAWFFKHHRAQKTWTANEWRVHHHGDNDTSTIPEVLFVGRSNVGKSSLLNAFLNDPELNRVSRTPGFTKVMHAYGLSENRDVHGRRRSSAAAVPNHVLQVIDSPGYGHASRKEWGEEMIKYLERRRNLKRVFVLIDARHGVKAKDAQIFDLLRQHTISYQVIATKCDGLEPPSKRQDLLRSSINHIRQATDPQKGHAMVSALGEIIAVGHLGDGVKNTKVKPRQMQGVSAVQFAVLRATGLDGYAYNAYGKLDESADFSDLPSESIVIDVDKFKPPRVAHNANSLFSEQTPTQSLNSTPIPSQRYVSQIFSS